MIVVKILILFAKKVGNKTSCKTLIKLPSQFRKVVWVTNRNEGVNW